ncbi:hypothetical protein SAMN05192564_11111 [Paraburkholderia sartisoli]|uniref:Uncharacterized protein n=1 Tax=Paraburkholderia sartisoli TaxID=83784 RepID=A0A1H4HP65_9BURK|nr:hypothetical protein SAMN05192564_11111 [Paraburkholderia sartisoli]
MRYERPWPGSKTATFDQPLPVFESLKIKGLRLPVLPFYPSYRRLLLPAGELERRAVSPMAGDFTA